MELKIAGVRPFRIVLVGESSIPGLESLVKQATMDCVWEFSGVDVSYFGQPKQEVDCNRQAWYGAAITLLMDGEYDRRLEGVRTCAGFSDAMALSAHKACAEGRKRLLVIDNASEFIGQRDWSDDALLAIRAAYNRRALDRYMDCIAFAIVDGPPVADWIGDCNLSPFNVGREVTLLRYMEKAEK